MRLSKAIIGGCLLTAMTAMAAPADEWVTIRNGQAWTDTDGNSVQAHGAGFLLVDDTFYMIGEDRSDTWHPDVNMYSSKDLVNWKFENKIIKNGVTHPELGSSRMIERPKLMRNPKTGKFVVWCHWEAGNYGASEAGVFQSDKVNGDYEFVWGGRPLDTKSRDCNVFVDDDGTAYFISTTDENTNLGLFKLSDDYLSAVEKSVLMEGQRREAPAIVKHNNRYYMLSSACSGWDPNPCKLSYTDQLTQGWSPLKTIGNSVAYDTQAASILTIKGSKATTYLYVGDRWQDPDLPESKTIIFPISFTDTDCVFEYVPEFQINFATGEWRKVEDPRQLDRTGWTVCDFSSQETQAENGAASNILDGDISTIWHTEYQNQHAVAPHHVTVDMGQANTIDGFLSMPRNDQSGNGLIRAYSLRVSEDGQDWKLVKRGSWLPYWTRVDFEPVKARYVKLTSTQGDYGSMSELYIYGTPGESGTPVVSVDTNSRAKDITYDLTGCPVENPVRGIYIRNNRKFVAR